jgi:hypothetical protein
MKLNIIKPRKVINKAFLKVKPDRKSIEAFKSNFIQLLDQINESEYEEFHKNIISEFLKNTYYKPDHYINTKGRTDLVIHNGKDAKSTVGILLETKKPENKTEMLSKENINSKAFHELVLYYLRERITNKNLEIKHIIATNIYEWFVFDANTFEKLFANNNTLVKQFTDFEEGRLSGKTTDFFYKQIAEPYIADIDNEISFAYIDIREYDELIRNENKQDDNKLIALYKLFSPEHLLKLPFANDSNSLDRRFYNELLHIIGLEETKEGNKKIIGRKSESTRNSGSLIENTINILRYEDCLSQIGKNSEYGATMDEQLFSVALELVISWINRILFLKLLEGQLLKYHNGDKNYLFLNIDRIPDYDALNKLFFQVLAIKEDERNKSVTERFRNIPYLNSSLFEPNELEHNTIRISNLEDEYNLPILNNTVLKEKTGKRKKGEINTLQYLFEFLDAYDFASEGAEEIQEESKTLINASVLGLIFEKINGYKDGSFFTPGFITMYMCRETIRKAVVQKFNDAKEWKCETIDDIYDKIEDKKEANNIINSLKICDPAVGSGHFLVSALNEIIAIKSSLKILLDRQNRTLRDYNVEVINDDLVVTDDEGELFDYSPKNKESQRIQETLFHEKQTIIENCLFGVDINPNSVKICRLRLWIELLKNTYYKPETNFTKLETLPNIDINIKCGNSLVSRYDLETDIKKALKKSKWTIDSYRLAVMTYRNSENKEQKHVMQRLINDIKNDFETEIAANDKRLLRLNKLKGELLSLTTQTSLFELTKKEKDEWDKKVKKITSGIQKLETELKEIKNNKIYENAFEWRFEFPEVLNDDGDFVGFDIVIGNPPYFIMTKNNMDNTLLDTYINQYFSIKKSYSKNIFMLLIEKGIQILNGSGKLGMIVPEGLFVTRSYKECVEYINNTGSIYNITTIEGMVFDEANIGNIIFVFERAANVETKLFNFNTKQELEKKEQRTYPIIDKIYSKNILYLKNICTLFKGMVVKDRKNVIFDTPAKCKDKFLLGNCISKWTIDKWFYTNYSSLTIIGGTKVISKYEQNPRILIRRTGNHLCCSYLEEESLTESTLYSCWSNNSDFNNKFILGLLHSKLFDYIIKIKMVTNPQAFPQILMTDLESLPIIQVNYDRQKELIEKVDQILATKKQDPEADISALEAEIDQMVYKLYDLTEEEIEIIESS